MSIKPFTAHKGVEIYDPSVADDFNTLLLASQSPTDFRNPTTTPLYDDPYQWYSDLTTTGEDIWADDSFNSGLFIYNTDSANSIQSLSYCSGSTDVPESWYLTTSNGPRRIITELLNGDTSIVPSRASELFVDHSVTDFKLTHTSDIDDYYTGKEILEGVVTRYTDSVLASTLTLNDGTGLGLLSTVGSVTFGGTTIDGASGNINSTDSLNISVAGTSTTDGNLTLSSDNTDNSSLVTINSVTFDQTGNISTDGYVASAGNVSPSDKKLKTNIVNIENSLDKVQQLNGVMFEWKDDGKQDTGVIAQEVQEVLPEIVHDNGEHLTVDYAKLAGLFIESIKELKSEIDDIKRQLK